MSITFINKDAHCVKQGLGFSPVFLLLAPFYLAYCGDKKYSIIYIVWFQVLAGIFIWAIPGIMENERLPFIAYIASMTLFLIMHIYLSINYNRQRIKYLLNQGYRPMDPNVLEILQQRGIECISAKQAYPDLVYLKPDYSAVGQRVILIVLLYASLFCFNGMGLYMRFSMLN